MYGLVHDAEKYVPGIRELHFQGDDDYDPDSPSDQGPP